MAIDQQLLDILVCPKTKAPLIYFEEEEFFFCPQSQLKYAIKDDIPVMLVDEAESLDDSESERLLELARERGLANA